jgi:hypothetical protein
VKPPRFILPSPEELARVREFSERQLSPEEFDAYVRAPMSAEEREEILESVTWFRKRYPTAGERLTAARRAYQQWVRARPDAAKSEH